MSGDIREKVVTILRDRFQVAVDTIADTSDLRNDLDLDSIDLFDVMGLIERDFGVNVEMGDFQHAKTFGDLIAVLERIVESARAA